jgi:hypothetical protein
MTFTKEQKERYDELGYATVDKPHVGVHFDEFPKVYFRPSMFPVGHVTDTKGGQVCLNIKEARKYAKQQYERLITKELNTLYAHKETINDMDFREYDDNEDMGK